MGAEQRLQGYTAAHKKARARRAELKENASGRSSLIAPRSRLIVVAMRHPQGKCAHSESKWFPNELRAVGFPWARGEVFEPGFRYGHTQRVGTWACVISPLPPFSVVRPGPVSGVVYGTREDDHDRFVYGGVLLRRGRDPRDWRAERNGLLPLSVVPLLVRRPGKCVLSLATRGSGDAQGSGEHCNLPQDGTEPSPVLQALWRPFDDGTSSVEDGRRLCRDDPRPGVRAAGAHQLCRNSAADARRAAEAKGLSGRVRRLRRVCSGVGRPQGAEQTRLRHSLSQNPWRLCENSRSSKARRRASLDQGL